MTIKMNEIPSSNCSQPDDVEPSSRIDKTVMLMTNIMNYLSVSLYEGSFKQCHQEALSDLNSVYNKISKQPYDPPSCEDAVVFYNSFAALSKVTYTDDPDYSRFRKSLFNYINANTIDCM